MSGFAGTGRWFNKSKITLGNKALSHRNLFNQMLLEPYNYICQWDEKSTHFWYKNKESTLELG